MRDHARLSEHRVRRYEPINQGSRAPCRVWEPRPRPTLIVRDPARWGYLGVHREPHRHSFGAAVYSIGTCERRLGLLQHPVKREGRKVVARRTSQKRVSVVRTPWSVSGDDAADASGRDHPTVIPPPLEHRNRTILVGSDLVRLSILDAALTSDRSKR